MDHEELIIPAFQRVLDEIDAEIAEGIARAQRLRSKYVVPVWVATMKLQGRWNGGWIYRAYYDIIKGGRKRFEGSKSLRNYIVELGARGERYWLAERNKAAAE